MVINMFKGRTDMAVDKLNLDYTYDVDKVIDDIEFKKLTIDDELSKKIMKDKGIYYNLDNLNYLEKKDSLVRLTKSVIIDIINIIELKEDSKILIVGLGNDMVTPDSLGPLVLNKIEVTNHLDVSGYKISAIAPGVMGQTGMESADIIKAIVDEFSFDLIIVIDALASSNPSRLCNSIQISTAGISPGAGVYNNRLGINKESMDVDVIAIGIPTVCDIDVFTKEIENTCFVTPKDIDQAMDALSLILAEGINEALYN